MLSATRRRWPAPGAQVCRQCASQLLHQPQRWQQRSMTGKAHARYGPKYTAKIDAANEQWEEKALKIKAGDAPAMWDVFQQRGYVKDVAGNPDDISKLLTEKRIGAYVGIDPTAASLHVGHLLPLMPLFWMYINGYRAVTLLGGATGKIGDPTGRLKSRQEMRSSEVAMNLVKLHYQVKKLWVNVELQARRFGYQKDWSWRRGVLQNSHWWNKLPMLEVLKRLGAGLRIGPMLSRDTVKRKMQEGDGMSFAEFSYPLMQAWDWYHMYNAQGVQMQIGGSDQYGNIVTGMDAFRIIRGSEPDPAKKLPEGLLYDPVGFTVPLLTDSSGNKFGKSAGNALWLDRFQTPAFDLYGYFVRRPDADAENLLRLFTFIPLEQISQIMAEHNADPAKRLAQHTLAYEVLILVHGLTEANLARKQHRAMYDKAAAGEEDGSPSRSSSYTVMNDADAVAAVLEDDPSGVKEVMMDEEVAKDADADGKGKVPVTLNNAPRVDLQLPRSLFNEGKVARILYAAELCKSVAEGNRLAVQKGAYVGASPGQKARVNKGMLMTQVDFTPVSLWFPEDTKNFIIDDRYMVLRKGKHTVRVVEIVSDEEWKASGKTYPGQPFTGKTRKLREHLKNIEDGLEVEDDWAKSTVNRKSRNSRLADSLEPPGGDAAAFPKLKFPEKTSATAKQLEDEIEAALQKKKGKDGNKADE